MPGLTDFARNKLHDFMLRGKSLVPPSTLYVRLCSTAPTPAAAGTAIGGTGYTPQPINSTTTAWSATNADGSTADPSTGTSGTGSNNAIINFGTAGSNWGTASHWELWDAASGGNRWFFGEIVDGAGNPAPRAIVTGDPVSIPAAGLRFLWA